MKLFIVFALSLLSARFILQNDKYKEAKKLYDTKHYNESICICSDELTKLQPRDSLFTEFLLLRSNDYTETHRYQHAINDYLSLIKIHPGNGDYYAGIAYVYGENKEYKNCIDVLLRGLKRAPENTLLLNNYCYYANYAGDFEDALNYADKALALKIDDNMKGLLLSNRGNSYIGIKKYELALKDIEEAIKLNPDNSFAYCYRAIANANLKRFETVCNDLEKAKSLGAVNLTADLIKQYCTH